MKNKNLCLITSFVDIEKVINSFKFTLNELAKDFENIFIINSENLKFFRKKNYLINFEKLSQNLGNNIEFIDPKNSDEFVEFVSNKQIVMINSLGQSYSELKVHFLLNRKNISQIMISNVGNIQGKEKPTLSKLISFIFFKKIPKYLYLFFYGMGLLKKVSVRFTSNRYIYENFKDKRFSSVKNYELINSRSFDNLMLNNSPINEENIVFLNPDINHPEWVQIRGTIDENTECEIYSIFESFLEGLSNLYSKKVVVCIHPLNRLDHIKKLFKNFDVVQFETPENIRKAEIVIFADSSSIVDAITLKKKIVCIKRVKLNQKFLNFVPAYHNIGLFEIELGKKFEINKNEFEKKFATSNLRKEAERASRIKTLI